MKIIDATINSYYNSCYDDIIIILSSQVPNSIAMVSNKEALSSGLELPAFKKYGLIICNLTQPVFVATCTCHWRIWWYFLTGDVHWCQSNESGWGPGWRWSFAFGWSLGSGRSFSCCRIWIGAETCHVRLDNKQMAEYVRNKIHSVGISDRVV